MGRHFPRAFLLFAIFFLLLPAHSPCVSPANDAQYLVNGSISLCTGEYQKVRFVMNNNSAVLDCNGSTIDGINQSLNYRAVDLNSKHNTTVKGCTITRYYYGIYSQFTDYSNWDLVFNNTFLNNSEGIDNLNNDRMNVTENNFTSNGYGIVAKSAYYYAIEGNRFTNNTYKAIDLASLSSIRYSKIAGNFFTNNVTQASPLLNIDAQLAHSNISRNNFSFSLSPAITVSGTLQVSNTTLAGNWITSVNDSAMQLFGIASSNVTGNSITGTLYNGIYFSCASLCNGNLVDGNNITGNGSSGSGIYAISLNGTVFKGNRVSGYQYPFFFFGGTSNLQFYDNSVNSTSSNPVNGNETNSFNATLDCSRSNIAGGPCSGGNYWANSSGGYSLACQDSGGDGFCDSPYSISGITDHLPIAQYNASGDLSPPGVSSVGSSPGIRNATISISLNETGNMTIAYGDAPNSLGNSSQSQSFSLSHNITLAGLHPNTTVFFNLTSCDPQSNCMSDGTWNFSTLPPGEAILINSSHWDGNTTNFSLYSEAELSNLSGAVFSNPLGRIEFLGPLNLSDGADLSGAAIYVSQNEIALNSSLVPQMNRSARLTFLNVTIEIPIVKRDGLDCPAEICAGALFNNSTGTYSVNVSSFSVYSLAFLCSDGIMNYDEEGVDCGGSCSACPITTTTPSPTTTSQGGSSSGGGSGGFFQTTSTSFRNSTVPSNLPATTIPQSTTNKIPERQPLPTTIELPRMEELPGRINETISVAHESAKGVFFSKRLFAVSGGIASAILLGAILLGRMLLSEEQKAPSAPPLSGIRDEIIGGPPKSP